MTSAPAPLDLPAIARILLDPDAPMHEAKRACDTLYDCGLSQLPPLSERDSRLDAGRALAPSHAARCVQDVLRTARLAQAVAAAIEQRLRQRPDRPVRLLYAGCGPLAPLALLPALGAGPRVRLVLIDIHQQSLDCARHLFTRCGLADRIERSWCADATRLRLPARLRPDIVIVEAMQRALDHEPQLAIVANLLRQCAADVILVPEQVRVAAWLANPEREIGIDAVPQRFELGTLLELSAATVPHWSPCLEAGAETLPPLDLRVPDTAPPGLSLMLRTRVDAGPRLSFADYESGLTYPRFEFALGAIQPGDRLRFQYRLGNDPGFTVRRIDAAARD